MVETKIIDEYKFISKKIPITIKVYEVEGEYTPMYEVSISLISKTTKLILEKIRQELITEVNLGMIEITETKKQKQVEEKFTHAIGLLVRKYFPNVDDRIFDFLTSYLIQKSLGLGEIEILMDDQQLEEIAINCASEPVWIYHRKHGWLKTNITPENEEQIKHWASTIGRKVGRQITILEPLLDATLNKGDRVNATLNPISTKGNTITIRKTATKPIVITDMLKSKTLDYEIASFIWLAIQFELSTLVSGGTASGKTSMLNCCACFFPPNQRILSIEDTREILLPSYAHWIPMLTKLPNAEGKGEITMIDLLVNALRQRPDRIIVGEIRRKREAEVLFEAIHTGHSVYATVHANNVEETITRLTNPPIDIPKSMLPAISMVVNQYRNRRTGKRKTFEIAEILQDGTANILRKYEPSTDKHVKVNSSITILKTLSMYTGMTPKNLANDLAEKKEILGYLVEQGYDEVETIGRVMAEYYTSKETLMKFVKAKKYFGKAKVVQRPAEASAISEKLISQTQQQIQPKSNEPPKQTLQEKFMNRILNKKEDGAKSSSEKVEEGKHETQSGVPKVEEEHKHSHEHQHHKPYHEAKEEHKTEHKSEKKAEHKTEQKHEHRNLPKAILELKKLRKK